MKCWEGKTEESLLKPIYPNELETRKQVSSASIIVMHEEDEKRNRISTLSCSSTGVTEMVLSGPKRGVFSYVDCIHELINPAFPGTVKEFLNTVPGALPEQLRNKVKLCPRCNKPNGYTLVHCNGCQYNLTKVEIGFTDNLFTAFIFGIAKTSFPLTISMRYQSSSYLVFDDLLQLSPVHLNAIYTEMYLADLRSLFVKPQEGLAILQRMFQRSWGALIRQFLANKPFREKVLPKTIGMSNSEVKKHLILGLNFPPSQCQLHLQVILPPLMPFHYQMYRDGRHFTKNRFFPLEYMISTLKVLGNRGIHSANTMNINDLIDLIKSKTGISYEAVWLECYARYGESHQQLASWNSEDFGRVIVNGSVIIRTDDMTLCDCQNVAAARKEDMRMLQNYGRPYINGKPSGTFYKHAKKAPLLDWLSV